MVKGHDKRYKKLFENHHLVEHLLKSFVGLDFINDLDFDNMVSIDKSFIDEEYQEKESDKIYRISYKNRDVYIYLLMEFQSTVDKKMPLRFLRYLLELSETYGKVKKTGLYPAVFPLLIYNGEADWTAQIEVSDLFDGNIPKKFIPKFEYFPIIIKKIPKRKLLRIHNAVSAIFLVENSSPEEYHKAIKQLSGLIVDALPDEISSLALWINSKFREKGIPLSDEEVKSITKPKEVVSMFAANLDRYGKNLEQKAKIEGKIEGKIEAKKELALKLLEEGTEPEFVLKVTGMSLEELKKLK